MGQETAKSIARHYGVKWESSSRDVRGWNSTGFRPTERNCRNGNPQRATQSENGADSMEKRTKQHQRSKTNCGNSLVFTGKVFRAPGCAQWQHYKDCGEEQRPSGPITRTITRETNEPTGDSQLRKGKGHDLPLEHMMADNGMMEPPAVTTVSKSLAAR